MSYPPFVPQPQTGLNAEQPVKIAFIYHVSYGLLLVRCHHVVNKGRRLSPSASLRFLCLRINCTLCSRPRRALCFGIHRTLCLRLRRALRLAFVAPVFAHSILHLPKQPLAIGDMSVRTVVTLHIYDNVAYRKTRRPPAEYSPDVGIVEESCRADGEEEHAIVLLPVIFSGGISEKALTRRMTRQEARKHYNGISTQGVSDAPSQ